MPGEPDLQLAAGINGKEWVRINLERSKMLDVRGSWPNINASNVDSKLIEANGGVPRPRGQPRSEGLKD